MTISVINQKVGSDLFLTVDIADKYVPRYYSHRLRLIGTFHTSSLVLDEHNLLRLQLVIDMDDRLALWLRRSRHNDVSGVTM